MAKPTKTPVKFRKTCRHPGRIFNRCKNCPHRKR
jgi:hypothetical protein